MPKYTIMQCFGGFIIRKDIPGDRPRYLQSVYRKEYRWRRDYLGAKVFPYARTAQKHVATLESYLLPR